MKKIWPSSWVATGTYSRSLHARTPWTTEDDGIDSVIIINPVGGKPSRYSSSQDDEDNQDGQDSQDGQDDLT